MAESNTCSTFRGEQTTLLVVYYWINTVVANYLPFCSLLVMNFLIIHSIKTRRTNFIKTPRSVEGSSAQGTSNLSIINTDGNSENPINTQRIENQKSKSGPNKPSKPVSDANLITMLLLVSFSFTILSAPMYISYVVYIYVDRSASPEAFGLFVLITEITFELLNISYANNFYLYCLRDTQSPMLRARFCTTYNLVAQPEFKAKNKTVTAELRPANARTPTGP